MEKGIGEARLLALKIIAESYLILKGESDYNEDMFVRKIDSATQLSDGVISLLKSWLKEKYDVAGRNLDKAIIDAGEQVVEGKLTNYELEELVTYADELIVQLSVFTKYSDSKNNSILL